MPFVRVRHDPRRPLPDLEKIVKDLPEVVADALGCDDPEGSLSAHDIEVAVEEFGPMDISGDYDVQIMVEANDYPSRKANLKERTQQIADAFAKDMNVEPGTTFYVWVRLSPAAFIEGEAT